MTKYEENCLHQMYRMGPGRGHRIEVWNHDVACGAGTTYIMAIKSVIDLSSAREFYA